MSGAGVLLCADESAIALTAAEWAATAAARMNVPLTACVVFHDPHGSQDELHRRGVHIAGSAIARVRVVAPDVPTQQLVRYGDVAEELAKAATDAQLIVVGRPTTGWHLMGGAVSFHLAARAPCPVAAVPWDRPDPEDPVLVGIGESVSAAAVEQAFAIAERDGVGVHAIRAYQTESLRAQTESYLRELVEPWADKHPTQPVSLCTELGDPVTVLALASRHASALVVGPPGRGERIGSILGSPCFGALALSACPVIVAR